MSERSPRKGREIKVEIVPGTEAKLAAAFAGARSPHMSGEVREALKSLYMSADLGDCSLQAVRVMDGLVEQLEAYRAALQTIADKDLTAHQTRSGAHAYRTTRQFAREVLNPATTPPCPYCGMTAQVEPSRKEPGKWMCHGCADTFPASRAGTSSAEGTNEANAAGPGVSSPATQPQAAVTAGKGGTCDDTGEGAGGGAQCADRGSERLDHEGRDPRRGCKGDPEPASVLRGRSAPGEVDTEMGAGDGSSPDSSPASEPDA